MDVVTVKRQAEQFPSVGMTLRSYQYDASDRQKRRGQPALVKTGRWQRLKQKVTLKRAAITAAIVVLILVGWVGGKFAYNAHKLFGGNILGILHPTKLKGEDQGRVNILLAGNSSDDAGHNGGRLTDSIMLVSIDTRHNKMFMLSIPRDLYTEIDGGHARINEAYPDGEDSDFNESGYPKGGMGQLEQVVSRDFGVDINYYALINYTALRQMVDAVGGITITIKSDDPRGIYDPSLDWTSRNCCALVKYPNGPVKLNGKQALNLARARGDAYGSYGYANSDFTRTMYQREMLVALKSKVVTAGVLANPTKLTSLSDAIGNNVKTDFSISEVRRLYDLTKNIPGNQIKSLGLNDADGKNLLTGYTTSLGAAVQIPAAGLDDFSDIRAYVKRMTSSDPVVQESAKIVVLNGTDTDGLAGRIKNRLTARDLNVTEVDDAGTTGQVTTTIINASGNKKPATQAALIKLFGNHVTTQNPYSQAYDADFIIIVGSDQAATNPANP